MSSRKRARMGSNEDARNKTDPEITEELGKYAQEVEPIIMKHKNGSVTHIGYRPTYKAMLAQRGLLVKETIGSGSYSKVKATINERGDRLAVKIIDRAKAPKDFQERFLPRELQVWPAVKHNNIIRMHDHFQDSRRVYMIIEYAPGGDALRYVQKTGALSEHMARTWVHQVADAVRYLHDMNITHRDLKLENLLLDNNKNIKICDFGFVKTKCTMGELSKTFCGSKSYAAPEILQGEPYEPKKADIWAIGVILFILVTGKMPFDESKGNSHLLEEHKKLLLYWPRGPRKVSSECKSLIRFCFAFDWRTRPTIEEVLPHNWFRMHIPASSAKLRKECYGNVHGSKDETSVPDTGSGV